MHPVLLLMIVGYLLPAPLEFRPPLGALPPPPPPRLPPWPVRVCEGPRFPIPETDYDGDQA